MAFIYLLNFNNYFNRKIIKKDTLGDYQEFILDEVRQANFNPNDDVITEIVLNTSEQGNYVLVFETDSAPLLTDIPTSRWFVTGSVRLRGKQYKLTLKRDVVADYYDKVITAPTFVEKGYVQVKDPAIYNKEGVSVNQIKTRETLLKDKSDCGWLVAYISKNISGLPKTYTMNYSTSTLAYTPISTTFANWEYHNYIDNSFYIESDPLEFQTFWDKGVATITSGDTPTAVGYALPRTSRPLSTSSDATTAAGALLNAFISDKARIMRDAYTKLNCHSTTDYNAFKSFDGLVIKDTEGKFYRISIYQSDTVQNNTNITNTDTGLFTDLSRMVTNSHSFSGNPDNNTFYIVNNLTGYKINYAELTDFTATYTITSNHASTSDALYDIIAIPYGEVYYYRTAYGIVTSSYNITKEVAMAFATSLGTNLGSNVYDIQLLPYSPVQDLLAEKRVGSTIMRINITNLDPTRFGDIMQGENKLGTFFYVDKSNFSFNLDYQFKYPIYDNNLSVSKKLSNECDVYRLVSPNYSGTFEFSVVKNGNVQNFNVDCTYKPYNPYIHINPNFNNLYGQDFDDARGLICGGDFSFGMLTDAFTEYELQNKNYNNIFNRQIENMDINNKLARTEAIVGGVAGALSAGVAAGGAAGLATSNPLAIGGAAIGGAALSGVGAYVDYNILKQRQNEAKSFAKDMFEYNIQNVQALPYSLSKCSAFTANNKIVPFIEYYTCTEEERNAFINKLKTTGMSVMRVDTIQNYLHNEYNYIKGQIIRLEDFTASSHIAEDIYNEIARGLYFEI